MRNRCRNETAVRSAKPFSHAVIEVGTTASRKGEFVIGEGRERVLKKDRGTDLFVKATTRWRTESSFRYATHQREKPSTKRRMTEKCWKRKTKPESWPQRHEWRGLAGRRNTER